MTAPNLPGATPAQYIRFARLCADASGSGPADSAARAAATAAQVTPCTVAMWAEVAAEMAAISDPKIDFAELAKRAMKGLE